MAKPEPTVYVVDDDYAVRDSVACLVKSVDLAVETFESADEFLESYRLDGPGCLVLDVRLPRMSGIELLDELALRQVDLPVVIITGHGDVPMAVQALKKGAIDFIEKPFNDQVFLDRVQQVIRQHIRHRDKLRRRADATEQIAHLSERERQVLHGVVEGKPSKVIAIEIGISRRTVEAHRAKIMHKLSAKSMAELIRIAVRAEEAG